MTPPVPQFGAPSTKPPVPSFGGVPSSSDAPKKPGGALPPAVPKFDDTKAPSESRPSIGAQGPPVPAEPAAVDESKQQTEPTPKGRVLNDKPLPKGYVEPDWSAKPKLKGGFDVRRWELEVLKGGVILESIPLDQRAFYTFGRIPDLVDVALEHESVSRTHCVLQFRETGECYIYDLGSTHGTFVNKKAVQPRSHRPIHIGDVLKFGQSTRLYVLCGPEDAPQRDPLAGTPAARDGGVARAQVAPKKEAEKVQPDFEQNYGMWGDVEDAQESSGEEDQLEDSSAELDKLKREGKMTEKQLELYEKVVAMYEKRNNIQGETKNINAKENSQDAGLTDGQRGQIDKNDKSIKQLQEKIENAEDTIFAMAEDKEQGGRKRSAAARRKAEEDDGIDSDEDEFYNRVEKKARGKPKAESVDSLQAKLRGLDDRRYTLEEKLGSLDPQGNSSGKGGEAEEIDELDAYMLDVAGQQTSDDRKKLESELAEIESEEKSLRKLLQIAAPALAGLAAKGDAREKANKAKQPAEDEEALLKAQEEADKAKQDEDAAAELRPEQWVEKRGFGGSGAAGAQLVEQQAIDKRKPLVLGSGANVDSVGNMTGHKAAPFLAPVEKPWLDLKSGGLQANPNAKRKGPSMGPLARGANGGVLQNSRYAAVEEKAFVPKKEDAKKQEELRAKLGY